MRKVTNKQRWKHNHKKTLSKGMILLCATIPMPSMASMTMPFNGCTFYRSRLLLESFGGGQDHAGCAQFSAVNGRNGCTKIKGVCPYCVKYRGDHVQMWLPDYFIEITKHLGRSAFAESLDGKILAKQLSLATKWWTSASLGTANPLASNGFQSPTARDSFWHARILTVPYGSMASNFPPLSVAKGNGLPSCYSALSEFMPGQWNFNLADASYAAAWAPVGIPLCLSIIGGGVMGGLQEAKAAVGGLAGGSGDVSGFDALQCANPVGAKEAFLKNAIPSSDALAPMSGDVAGKLCMGSWGNLLPRTGWITSEDPHMSAMLAAYKFQSAAGDFHLNGELKLRPDDKWQIVYPPRLGGKCFTPGSPFKDLPPAADDPMSRGKDELTPFGNLKSHTYIIAVWRRRSSCEEPLQWVSGWSADFKMNYFKNLGVCKAAGAL